MQYIVLLADVKTAVTWPVVHGNYWFPQFCCSMSKFTSELICEVTLTVSKTPGARSSSQRSAERCSCWRRDSSGAALVAVPCKRHDIHPKNDGEHWIENTRTVFGGISQHPVNELTLAGNLLGAFAWATQTHCTSSSRSTSSWWSTRCWSETRRTSVTHRLQLGFDVWLWRSLHLIVLLTCKQIS